MSLSFSPIAPDRPEMLQVATAARSLLATWNYSNPPLSQGPLINGYRLYVKGSNYILNHTTSDLWLNVTGLTPFTNYTVQVLAFNTMGDGSIQRGPMSDSVTAMTLEDGR